VPAWAVCFWMRASSESALRGLALCPLAGVCAKIIVRLVAERIVLLNKNDIH
jgi:hypothetical protein